MITPRYSRQFLEHIAPDGYTPLPNLMIEEFWAKNASLDAIKVALFVARWSWGEGQQEAELTDDEFIHGKVLPPGYVDRGLDTIPESFLQKLSPYSPLPHQIRAHMTQLESKAAMYVTLYLVRHTWGEGKVSRGFDDTSLQAFAHQYGIPAQALTAGLEEAAAQGLLQRFPSRRWHLETLLYPSPDRTAVPVPSELTIQAGNAKHQGTRERTDPHLLQDVTKHLDVVKNWAFGIYEQIILQYGNSAEVQQEADLFLSQVQGAIKQAVPELLHQMQVESMRLRNVTESREQAIMLQEMAVATSMTLPEARQAYRELVSSGLLTQDGQLAEDAMERLSSLPGSQGKIIPLAQYTRAKTKAPSDTEKED